MKQNKREKRDKEIFLYKTGLESSQKHTLFETALHYNLSVNQIFLNCRKFQKKIIQTAQVEGIIPTAQKYGLSTGIVERLLYP